MSTDHSASARVEEMLAAFSRQGAPEPPPPEAAPETEAALPPPPAAAAARSTVRPLWSAGGAGASSRPWSQWLQSRPLWALMGLVLGVAGSQGWQQLRQQEQRNQALASVGRMAQGSVQAAVPVDTVAAPVVQAPTPPVVPPMAPPPEPLPAPLQSPPQSQLAPVPPPTKPAPVAKAAPAVKPSRPPASPASMCRKAKGAEFERCLQIQCRKDRFFAHRHCIALYERAIRP